MNSRTSSAGRRPSRGNYSMASFNCIRTHVLQAILLGTILTTAICPAQNERLEEVKKEYGFADWDRQPQMRNGFYFLALTFEHWKARDLFLNRRFITRTFSGKDQPDPRAAFTVEAFVADSVEEAHEVLIGWLASRAVPGTLPPMQKDSHPNHQSAVGNISYIAGEGGTKSSLFLVFTRGNIAVRMSGAHQRLYPKLDREMLLELALKIDSEILKRPAPPNQKPERPRILEFEFSSKEFAVGGSTRLVLKIEDPGLEDPAQKNFLTNLRLSGKAQAIVNRDKEGDWSLRFTDFGEMTVVLEVVSSIGTYTRQERKLNILRPLQRP